MIVISYFMDADFVACIWYVDNVEVGRMQVASTEWDSFRLAMATRRVTFRQAYC